MSDIGDPAKCNPACVLAGYGPCGGKISGEHYISHAVLRRIAPDGGITLSGTPWASARPKNISKSALTANILCQVHNSGLSPLDSVGGRWMASIQDAQLALAGTSARSQTHTFDGLKLERWFLKIAFMLWHSGNFAAAGAALEGAPPSIWASLLSGTAPFPPNWGLYIPTSGKPVMAVDREFSVLPLTGNDGSGIKAVHFEMARMPFWLLLGNPDEQALWGNRRPRQFDLGNQVACHRLRLTWPEGEAGEAVTAQRIADPPTSEVGR